MFAPGAMPMPPTCAASASDSRSPVRLQAAITSNSSGRVRICCRKASVIASLMRIFPAGGKILIKDAITDAFLQQILTRPDEFDVIAACNLTGDLLSDALAAQVGGIGIAPGANINYDTGHALFEATHGTAPKYAGQDKVNPGSVILSGEMMFRYLGWTDAADRLVAGLEKTIQSKVVTYDFARLMEGAKEVKCSEFGSEIIKNMATL